jgi:ribosomal protein S18 acetylase RimI-like enzyme
MLAQASNGADAVAAEARYAGWTRKMVPGELEVDGAVVVRRLRPEDTDLLRTIRLAALEESPDAFGETLEGARTADWSARAVDGATFADRAVFVAVTPVQPVGMVFVKCASPPEPAFLGGMWVSPGFRRRGVGHSLVQQGREFLRLAGQTEVSLWVTRGNHGVLAFYRFLGFRETGSSSILRPGSDVLIDELRCSLG